MALLWFDGFENYNTDTSHQDFADLYFWGCGFHANYGRNGMGLSIGSSAYNYQKSLISSSATTYVLGIALHIESATVPSYHIDNPLLRFKDNAIPDNNTHVKIHLNSSRLIEARNNAGTLLGTSSGHSIDSYTWYYLEVKVIISDTVGQVIIKVNGNTVLTTTADKDTLNGSNAYVNCFEIHGTFNLTYTYFDDLYFIDSTGSVNNDFLGDIRVDVLRPDSAGTYTQFTPSTGSNYQNVDEQYPDDDTTYNESGSSGDKDTYNLDALPAPASATIHGVKSQIVVRKSDSGAKQSKPLMRSGTTDTLGATIQLSNSYTAHHELYELNPDDSAAWEDADVNALQVGVQVTS